MPTLPSPPDAGPSVDPAHLAEACASRSQILHRPAEPCTSLELSNPFPIVRLPLLPAGPDETPLEACAETLDQRTPRSPRYSTRPEAVCCRQRKRRNSRGIVPGRPLVAGLAAP